GYLLFGAAQQERVDQLAQLLLYIGFLEFIDRRGKLVHEKLPAPEQTGIQEVHLGIQIKGIVLQRGAAQGQPVFGLQQQRSLAYLRLGIFDRLRFVENDIVELELPE